MNLLAFGGEASRKFVTNVGLITTNGTFGDDIMACEWTNHISYNPSLIAISVSPKHATHKNIDDKGEFGVNIASVDQAVMASISGEVSGRDVDKIKVLEELNFKFYKAKKIDVLMVEGASANIECKLIKKIDLGDHTMFVGEAVEVQVNNKKPLVYHDGKYGQVAFNIPKPSEEEKNRFNDIIKRYHKRVL